MFGLRSLLQLCLPFSPSSGAQSPTPSTPIVRVSPSFTSSNTAVANNHTCPLCRVRFSVPPKTLCKSCEVFASTSPVPVVVVTFCD
ncbi:uncharacterized protein LAJ45_07127 [Morchella importuna]|uniref:uncharacterized protein n=1 Tax=Morchella importuna TaxID=1174673 RepID=UPI001E8DE5B1|nr:uncharacterized protein LAJ45_07127 [Morchella importuna]KAH8148784.1 hypothetical protein LAJ45_07127 [Morchella importuna]